MTIQIARNSHRTDIQAAEANTTPSSPSCHQTIDSTELLAPPQLIGLSGDVGAAVMVLILKQSKEEFLATKEQRELSTQSLLAAQSKEIDDMRDAAENNFKAGISAGIGQVAEGGCTIASGSNSANAARWKGTADACGGSGKIAESFFKADADRANSRVEHDKMLATQFKDSYDTSVDQGREARTLGHTVLDFLKEYEDSMAQCRRAQAEKV